VGNIDATVVCERPAIAPHTAAMRERLAAACGFPADRVSVKATTNERLGALGREEGIAALATVLLLPRERQVDR
jgi:2-C-methyl-D-erythritol 2,4-cyclodiphosphate synthase